MPHPDLHPILTLTPGEQGTVPGPQPGRRRRFTTEEKRRFLKEASGPGESMSSVGRRHGLSVSLLFRWRRQLEGAHGPTARSRAADASLRAEVRELRGQVRELERLLGKKTLELEMLREDYERARRDPEPALTLMTPREGSV
jgi:transposase